jgi:hypothetical protein
MDRQDNVQLKKDKQYMQKTKTDDFYNIIHKILCSCNQCELYIIVHNFKLSPWVVNS